MTDILIRGMDMPSRCDAKCPLYNTVRGYYDCTITKRPYNWGLIGRPSDCPLVELPPHGDLIDRDAAVEESEKPTIFDLTDVPDFLREQPVIVPSNKEETE